jgi:hypothetical protein
MSKPEGNREGKSAKHRWQTTATGTQSRTRHAEISVVINWAIAILLAGLFSILRPFSLSSFS